MNNESKVDYRFEGLFEFDYARGCKFNWPFSSEVDTWGIIYHGFLFYNMEDLLKDYPIFKSERLKEYLDFENEESEKSEMEFPLDYSSEDYTMEQQEEDELREKLLISEISHWEFKQIVCSALFSSYVSEISKNGFLASTTWMDIGKFLVHPQIGPELLAVIKRNGFFELNPQQAVRGSYIYLESLCLFPQLVKRVDGKLPVLRLLEALHIDDQLAHNLAEKVAKDQSVSCIVVFLKDYTFLKEKGLSLIDVENLLNCVDLSQNEKLKLAEESMARLQNLDVSITNFLGSWDEMDLAISFNIGLLYESSNNSQVRKDRTLLKKTYSALCDMRHVIGSSTLYGEYKNIICYPPVSLVRKYLQTSKSQINREVERYFFSPQEYKQDKSFLPYAQSLVALFYLLCSAGGNIIPGLHNNRVNMAIIVPITTFARSFDKFENLVEQKNNLVIEPKVNTTLKKLKGKNISIQTNRYGKTSLSGNFGSYSKLTSISKDVKGNSKEYGELVAREENDHIIFNHSLCAMKISKSEGIALIVPSSVNRLRTNEKQNPFERPDSLNYENNPDFLDAMHLLATNSVASMSLDKFTQKEEINFKSFGDFFTLTECKEFYIKPIKAATQQINELYLLAEDISPSNGLLSHDMALINYRLTEKSLKINSPPSNLDQFSKLVEEDVSSLNDQCIVGRSLIAHLAYKDKPMPGYVRHLETIHKSATFRGLVELKRLIGKYNYLDTEGEGSYSQQILDTLEKDLKNQNSSAYLGKAELNLAMRKGGFQSMYPRRK